MSHTTINIRREDYEALKKVCKSNKYTLSRAERVPTHLVALLIENKELVLDKIRKKQNWWLET